MKLVTFYSKAYKKIIFEGSRFLLQLYGFAKKNKTRYKTKIY